MLRFKSIYRCVWERRRERSRVGAKREVVPVGGGAALPPPCPPTILSLRLSITFHQLFFHLKLPLTISCLLTICIHFLGFWIQEHRHELINMHLNICFQYGSRKKRTEGMGIYVKKLALYTTTGLAKIY